MNELITVVVPVYRVEKYLCRCVESIRNQTYTNLEIILVDDGSDDLCPKICDDYLEKDSRIKVLHQKNGGLSIARNSGIDIARGEYIAFVDSDDCISPYYIEYLYRAIIETGSCISQCNYEEFDSDSIDNSRVDFCVPIIYSKFDMLKNLSTSGMNVCSVVAWTKLYKTSLFEEIRYTPGKLHEDEFTTYKIFDRVEKIAYLDMPLYRYFINAGGITRAKLTTRRLDGLEALLERYQYYKKKEYNKLACITANHFIENVIVFTKERRNASDTIEFNERFQTEYLKAKDVIALEDFNRHNRVLFKFAVSVDQFARNYKLYLLLGKVSHKCQISVIRNYVSNIRQKSVYKKEIRELFRGYIPEKTVFILGTIEYENLGDHAIIFAQKAFIQRALPQYKIIEIRAQLYENARQEIVKVIQSTSLITIPGGGNMGNLWFDDEKRRRWAIQDFPNNKVVVFPQTIFYDNTDEGEKKKQESVKLYNEHKNLTLCAREMPSYELMKTLYPLCNVIFVPDIVLSLSNISFNGTRSGIGVCFREDKERKITAKEYQDLEKFLLHNNKQIMKMSTVADYCIPYQQREDELEKIWTNISKTELFITDRLHGMIFSYLTRTPCVVLDNNNHKVRTTYLQWLKQCDFIFFAEPENLIKVIKQALKYEGDCKEVKVRDNFKILEENIIDGKNSSFN